VPYVKNLWLYLHFQGTSDGDFGLINSGTKTLSMGSGDVAGRTLWNQNWFEYVCLNGLSLNTPITFDIIVNKGKAGEATISLKKGTDSFYIEIEIVGIDIGAKDWQVVIGNKYFVEDANNVKSYQVPQNDVEYQNNVYIVYIPGVINITQGQQGWSYDIENFLYVRDAEGQEFKLIDLVD
jgi:hypothetical protein